MNYKLKDIARHLLNLQAREFPGQVNRLHLDDLVAYLKSDLLVTRELYDQLQGQLDFTDRVYNNQLIAPITPLLVRMAVAGVQADPNFVREETQRLLNLTECMSEMHDQRFSISLDAGDFRLRGWLYFDRNGLRCKKIPTGKKRLPSLRTKDLKTLYQQAGRDARESLALIHDYNMTRSLMIRLRSLEQHIDRESHRIHSNFNDFRQSRGDFYTFVATRMLDQDLDDGKREQVKRTSLGIVNGMSAKGLAKQLDEDESVARNYLEAFAMTYPQVITFSDLTKHIFAATGEALTFGGRRRRISPHWWMVNKPVVELFISYKDNDKLWLRVVPLRPNRFTLTCWVLRVIDAKYGSPNEGQEIYNHRVGRISQAP